MTFRAKGTDRACQPMVGISKTIVGAVFHELAQMGYAPREGLLASSTLLVSGRDADAVLEDAGEQLRDTAIAITVAKRLAIGSLGEIDYALCTSDSLRVGLGRVARFYHVATERVTLALEVDGESRATLVFRANSNEPYSRHWREFAVAVIARRIRQTVGRDVRFLDVGFAHSAPKNARAHAAFFGAPVRFGEDADRLAFAPALLNEPLRTAVVALADLLEARVREMETRGGPDAAVLARVRRAITAQVDTGDPTLASTAKRLAMSTRTLQRELGRAASSHKAVLDDVRRERALALLETGRMSIVDISARLGFSGPRAFFRAFRRWTGTTPATMRPERSR